MTWLEAVKDEAAKLGKQLDDSTAEYILWEYTGCTQSSGGSQRMGLP